ncbi:hypothetical protein Plhal703r1_c09g0047631 [Plasmopara halstedii]
MLFHDNFAKRLLLSIHKVIAIHKSYLQGRGYPSKHLRGKTVMDMHDNPIL